MTQHTAGEVEGFIDLLRAACENIEINNTLQDILTLPNADRREIIRQLLTALENEKAPNSLIEAIACLINDDIAEKAHEILNP